MSGRIVTMRQQLFQKLKAVGCPGSWDHIVSQKGMFSYTGLNGIQIYLSYRLLCTLWFLVPALTTDL